MVEHRAAETTGKDPCERLALVRVAPLVHEQRERPGRPFLVVAVARGEHDAEPREVDLVGLTLFDRPGERAVADSVRRAAARTPVDPPAGTGSVAVARLEVGPADPVGHYMPAPWPGTCNPGTVPGETATQTPSAMNATANSGTSRPPAGST